MNSNSSNLFIREMTITDYDVVMALWLETENMGISEADKKENIEFFLLRNPALSFTAWINGLLVGAVLCGHDGRRGAIYHLAVKKGFRNQGVAKSLVQHCLQGLDHAGIERCHIHVYGENQAGLSFWQSTYWFLRPELVLLSRDIP